MNVNDMPTSKSIINPPDDEKENPLSKKPDTVPNINPEANGIEFPKYNPRKRDVLSIG
jgi:hypothetical protein